MATTKLSNSGTTGAKYPTASAANNYMETIASTLVGAGGVSSITFSNIPQGYKHLQIRIIGRGTTATGGTYATGNRGQFNGDTGSNYSAHWLDGSGSAATAGGSASLTYLYLGNVTDSAATANTFGVSVVDILDYTNTSKYKTVRYLFGADGNGAGYVEFGSGLWMNTAAITSMYMVLTGGNFAQYTRISLYGIKG